MEKILHIIAQELKIMQKQAEAAVKLLDEGNTIPFIARYRKEATGSLDEEQLRSIEDRLAYLRGLEQRRQEILTAIAAQEKLVVITADNPDLKLKPRLTANVTIFTDTRENVLVVPNKALRFTPDKKLAGGKTINDCNSPKKVWTMDATSLTAHPVKTGMSDGSNTEIVSGISEGTEVITETIVKGEMPEMIESLISSHATYWTIREFRNCRIGDFRREYN